MIADHLNWNFKLKLSYHLIRSPHNHARPTSILPWMVFFQLPEERGCVLTVCKWKKKILLSPSSYLSNPLLWLPSSKQIRGNLWSFFFHLTLLNLLFPSGNFWNLSLSPWSYCWGNFTHIFMLPLWLLQISPSCYVSFQTTGWVKYYIKTIFPINHLTFSLGQPFRSLNPCTFLFLSLFNCMPSIRLFSDQFLCCFGFCSVESLCSLHGHLFLPFKKMEMM